MVLQLIAKLLKKTPERYQKQAKHLTQKNQYRKAEKNFGEASSYSQKALHVQKCLLN